MPLIYQVLQKMQMLQRRFLIVVYFLCFLNKKISRILLFCILIVFFFLGVKMGVKGGREGRGVVFYYMTCRLMRDTQK